MDGRARIDGVTGFLSSRGFELPLGDQQDEPGEDTAWAMANRKNELFLSTLERDGVLAFETTLSLIRELRALGRRTGVVTASRNADRILAAAGAEDLFEPRSTAPWPKPKASPESPTRRPSWRRPAGSARLRRGSVVVEDALAGVEAGQRGGFGLVVGVDRVGQADALGRAGADVVVTDLGELSLDEPLVRAS